MPSPFYPLCVSSCFLENSCATIRIAVTPAARSAIGAAYMMPSMPRKSGNSNSSGSRKIICLVNERKIPRFGLPIAVKKFEVIGCRKFKNVKNRKM